MKQKILSFAIIAASLVSLSAYAQKPGHSLGRKPVLCEASIKPGAVNKDFKCVMPPRHQNPLAGIELTPEQQKKVDALRDKRHKEMDKARDKQRKEMKKRGDKMDKEMKKILTPEQYARYESNKAASRQCHRGHLGKGEGRGHKGKGRHHGDCKHDGKCKGRDNCPEVCPAPDSSLAAPGAQKK